MNPFSHIDLRVTSFEKDLPFYEAFLPLLGFTLNFHTEMWKVFACPGELPSASYFAIREDKNHKPCENLVGFWAKNREEVDKMANFIQKIGGKILDGPRLFPISPTYYAVYFQDPCGNKYEIVHRLN
jgi:catechol 2,3-dioxygenase-like lactoylglutathione lyase family enzyme